MKPKLIFCLALVSSGIFSGCSTTSRYANKSAVNESISPKAEKIVRQVADYYLNLESFEGTNTLSDWLPYLKIPPVASKQFAFVRPNLFLVYPESTNNYRLFCDGTNFCEYRPYYFNSYTVTPAPARFEDVITNWVGGELLRLIIIPNRYDYIMSGFGSGLTALKYAGQEVVNGVTCHHVTMEEPGSKCSELWVAKGSTPFILKYIARYPIQSTTKQIGEHSEIISGWKANCRIPIERFIFVPPAGAIEHPPGTDQVEISSDSKTGTTKVRFYSREDLKYKNP
jgi:hypothetical protein